jgi:cytochrome c oxidase subunit 4
MRRRDTRAERRFLADLPGMNGGRRMSERVLSRPTYFLVFAILISLTLLTVGISFLDLGRWHAPAGLTIATCKAVLVALFFMHLLHSHRLTWVVVAGALFWLGILMVLTMADYLTRSWLAY